MSNVMSDVMSKWAGSIIEIDKQGQSGTTIFNTLDNTTELYMIKYTFGEIFSSSGATLCKNPSDQTVNY